MATQPRPFGTGPYGTSAYGVVDVAAGVKIVGAATHIRSDLQAELVESWGVVGPCFETCQPGTWTQKFPPWTERIAA